MKLDNMSYEEFHCERMSWLITQTKPLHFTDKEVMWAALAVKAGIFDGDECWDQQQIALDILVWCAQEVLNGRNK